MDLLGLEMELERIIAQVDIPSADITEAVVGCAKAGDWESLRQSFGTEGATKWRREYESNPEEFCERLTKFANECRSTFALNSSKRLTYLSRVNFVPGVEMTPIEKLHRIFDESEEMLQIAFARRLFNLIEPAAYRAAQLRELVVREASSEEADRYLAEACECYYFGLNTACALMCRSVMEEALEAKLPRDLLEEWREETRRHQGELTLGSLIYRLNNYPDRLVPDTVLRNARVVNTIGTRAAHKQTINSDDAKQCFNEARRGLLILLGGQ